MCDHKAKLRSYLLMLLVAHGDSYFNYISDEYWLRLVRGEYIKYDLGIGYKITTKGLEFLKQGGSK